MTNREKFIEVFDELPQTECPLIECEHTKCPYNDGHTNCIDQHKKMSMWWELEYKDSTARVKNAYKMQKETLMLNQIETAMKYIEMDLDKKSVYMLNNNRDYNNGYIHAIDKYYFILEDLLQELKEVVDDLNKYHEVIEKYFNHLLEVHNEQNKKRL